MKYMRKMGTQEKMDWIFNKVSPVNFVTYAQVRGDITEEKLCGALECLKKRHPLLNAGIAGHGWWSARFVCNNSSGIPLKILSTENGHELIPVIEAECMERFQDKGPLTRCVLFRHSRSLSTLMLTLDHALADGMSGVFAMRDLMLALGCPDDKTGSGLKPLEPAKPVEHYFPKNMLGLKGWLKHIVFFIRTIKNDFSAKNIVPCTPDVHAPYDRCRMHLITRELAPDVTEKLRGCAQTNGIKINSLLLAAQVIAAAQHRGITEPSTFTLGYDVDMRKRVSPAIDDHVGMFLSALVTSHTAHNGTDLTALAKDIEAAKETSLRNNELYIGYPKFLQILNFLLFIFGTGRLGAKIYTGIYKSFPVNAMISNLGNLDIETVYGDYTMEKIGFSVSSSVWGLVNLTAATLNGLMILNFTCLDPLVSKEHLCLIADRTIGILKENMDLPPS